MTGSTTSTTGSMTGSTTSTTGSVTGSTTSTTGSVTGSTTSTTGSAVSMTVSVACWTVWVTGCDSIPLKDTSPCGPEPSSALAVPVANKMATKVAPRRRSRR